MIPGGIRVYLFTTLFSLVALATSDFVLKERKRKVFVRSVSITVLVSFIKFYNNK